MVANLPFKIIAWFFIVLLAFLTVILQTSLISAWPQFFNQLNLVLIVLTINLFFSDLKSTLILTLLLGFWLDLNSFQFFGFYLLSLFATVLLATWLLKNWLTNRSLYSFLAISLILTVFYNFWVAILLFLSVGNQTTFFLGENYFWSNLIYQLIWSLIAAVLSFNVLAFLTQKLRPGFLEKKHRL